jgi:hypothetical protein
MLTSSPHPTVRPALPVVGWLVPYDRRVIVSPLAEATVRSQLAALVERLNAAPKPGWFSSDARYQGALDGDTITISGPIANRRFRLAACGVVRLDPAGTAIDVALRLSTMHLLITFGQLALLWAWVLIAGFPPVMALFMTCFFYAIVTFNVKYEAGQIIQKLLVAAGPPPAPEAQGAIVPDGVGWRCAACGGHVRRDATLCKHCKRVFPQ